MSSSVPSRSAEESKVEHAKRASRYLRGSIAEVLAADAPAFEEDDVNLLKFHGIYQQEDRDALRARRATGAEKEYGFMVRTRIPGGVLAPEQYLAFDRLAEQVSYNRSLRVTSRQTFQFHGILKENLKPAIAAINQALVSTLAACGDVGRNVMAPPAPLDDPAHQAARELAVEIGRELSPRTRAYHEIWLDGEQVAGGSDEADDAEPLYGSQYLPRKFKVAVALPDDNSVDVYSQDVGLVVVADPAGSVRAVNLLVGGGFGMTHRKADTYARLGTPLGAVAPEHAAAAVRVVAEIFRDHGNRSDRKHARLKYLLEDWGQERFREEFVRRASFPLAPWVEIGEVRYRDYLGAHPQGDDRYFYGIHVDSGRIYDAPKRRLKTALRKAVEALRPGVILTPNQNLLLSGLDADGVTRLETILEAYGAGCGERLSGARRYALACPALPTCGLALADSERFLPRLLEELETELTALGLRDTPLTVRMTGCPNGCARPYTADVGLVGRRAEHYDVFVGGRLAGDRFADLYAENVPDTEIVATLRPLFVRWRDDRLPGEGFGDFYQRRFGTGRKRILTGAKEPKLAVVTSDLAIAC